MYYVHDDLKARNIGLLLTWLYIRLRMLRDSHCLTFIYTLYVVHEAGLRFVQSVR